MATLLVLAAVVILSLAVGGPMIARTQTKLAEQRRRELYVAHIKETYDALSHGEHARTDELLRRYLLSHDSDDDLRGFAWYHLWKDSRRQSDAPQIPGGLTVHCPARSHDGKRLAMGTYWGRVRFFDSTTRQLLWTTPHRDGDGPGHDHIRGAVAFSADGQILVTCSRDQTLKVWDATSGRLFADRQLSGAGRSIAISSKNCVAVGLGEFHTVPSAEGISKPFDIELFQVNREDNGDVRVAPLERLEGGLGGVEALAIAPDDRVLAAGSRDGTVHRWNLETLEPLVPLPRQGGPVNDLKYSPDGQTLAASTSLERHSYNLLLFWRAASENGIPQGE